uniref:Uncharacterized protein n=1 Tax=Staphylothermus marinus TaxID=2280 RepID=A0A7C4DAC5_STAMA
MVYEDKFWEEEYWSVFGSRVWRIFKICNELIPIIGKDESIEYINTITQLSKYIVEKLSEKVEIEEPEDIGLKDIQLVIEFMKSIADIAIGKNTTVTLAWITRNITYEYIRANFTTIREKPDRFDYLASILDLTKLYDPPDLLKTSEVDLTMYHATGYLDNVEIESSIESVKGGRFRYVVKIRDKVNYEKDSLGSLIIRLGLMAWEILRRKPGIFSIFETIDPRNMYLEIARSRVPVKAHEIVETKSIQILGDGKVYSFKDEKIETDGSITITLASDQYSTSVPMPVACRTSVYELKGPLVYAYNFCQETDLLFKNTRYLIENEFRNRFNVVEFLRGIQPYIFLGLWDQIFIENSKFIVISRI